jgi:hypothetical protein
MRLYSMAVAPDSSLRKAVSFRRMKLTLLQLPELCERLLTYSRNRKGGMTIAPELLLAPEIAMKL